jgi:hypothetical protein
MTIASDRLASAVTQPAGGAGGGPRRPVAQRSQLAILPGPQSTMCEAQSRIAAPGCAPGGDFTTSQRWPVARRRIRRSIGDSGIK